MKRSLPSRGLILNSLMMLNKKAPPQFSSIDNELYSNRAKRTWIVAEAGVFELLCHHARIGQYIRVIAQIESVTHNRYEGRRAVNT